MTESQVVNGWISQGELRQNRRKLLDLLDLRFPGQVTADVRRVVNDQDSMDLLDEWFRSAVQATTYEAFLTVFRR